MISGRDVEVRGGRSRGIGGRECPPGGGNGAATLSKTDKRWGEKDAPQKPPLRAFGKAMGAVNQIHIAPGDYRSQKNHEASTVMGEERGQQAIGVTSHSG